MTRDQVKVVYAGCLPEVASQLDKHGAFSGDHVRSFPTLLRALDWCESVVIARARRNLNRAGVVPPRTPSAVAMMGGVGGGGASAINLLSGGDDSVPSATAVTETASGLRIKVPLAHLPDASNSDMDFPMPTSPGSTLVASQQQSVIKVSLKIGQL
jgi:hypothetical protein